MKIRSIIRNIYLNTLGAFKSPKPGIHIINSHYVTPNKFDINKDWLILEDYLNSLSKKAIFITLNQAIEYINSNKYDKSKVYIAFTFDDGFEECYSVIAP